MDWKQELLQRLEINRHGRHGTIGVHGVIDFQDCGLAVEPLRALAVAPRIPNVKCIIPCT